MDKEKVTAEEIKQAAAFHVYKVYGKSNYNAERDFIDGANFAIEKEDSDLVSRKELLEWAEREKKHCTTSIKKSTFKSDLCVIGAVQAYKNIISHLTQPKEGE